VPHFISPDSRGIWKVNMRVLVKENDGIKRNLGMIYNAVKPQ